MSKSALQRLIFSLLLVLLLVLSSCEKGGPTDTDTTDPAATQVGAETQAAFSITDKYILIRPEYGSDEEIAATQYVKRGLDSIFGVKLPIKTDWVKHGAEIEPYEFEILIGQTNRPQSQDAKAALGIFDYYYEIVSENVIAICGGSPEKTLEAARRFMLDIFGYEESADSTSVISPGHPAELLPGTSYISRFDYPVETLTIGGVPVTEYTLVSSQGEDAASKLIVSAISSLCGYNIPVVKPGDYAGGPAIFVGCANGSGGHLDLRFDSHTYYITATADSIIIDATTAVARLGGARWFVSQFIKPVTPEETVEITVSSEVLTGLGFSSDSNNLILSNVTETEIATGITYSERLYYDEESKPIRAYVLIVAPGCGILYTGTPGDGEVLLNKGGTVLEEMKAAAQNGKKVVAGVNADFFNISGDYLPRGLCIKEGKLLHGANSRPWFGVTYDGTPVTGSAAEYDKYANNLVTAVGGSNIMLKNGSVLDVDLGTDFGRTRHPRTAVGYRPDGTVVIIVVDGRQPSISNGASLADLASIFWELGCSDAINLDGGGSSTFILTGGQGDYVVKNSPSDGRLRKIQNSLLVLLP
ncbi:MAG: phosphodiester glycosidase family protein [Eubacteriales bacterium]|jgi:uncharacterized protein YigE (DUF2233 family)